MFVPVKENREPGIILEIRKGIVKQLGHVEKMSEESTVKNMSKNIQEGKRSVGKPRQIWLDDVENSLKKKEYQGLKKNGKRERLLEIDTEGGQGATWTVEPVESGNQCRRIQTR